MVKSFLIAFLSSVLMLGGPLKVEIHQQNATVKSFADAFSAQTGVPFSYESSLASFSLGKISLSYEDSLDVLLDRAFRGKGIEFRLVGDMVVLTKMTPMSPPLNSPGENAKPDRITVSGVVLDETGQGVIGAVVMEKGNNSNGVSVDFDGNYSIQVPSNASLLYECLSFISVEEQVNGRGRIDVTLREDNQQLDEVVVVGYGVQKKVNLTGSVSAISADDFKDRKVAQIGSALQGMVPNLNITQSSGSPDATSSFNIRGNTSPNGGSPLILVDGVETYLERINSNDIESISVLKDAASAAIYGARAAFGVILVTTKSGKAEQDPRVSFDARFSVSAPTTSTDYETRGYYSAYIADSFMITQSGTPYTSYTAYDYQRLWERRNDVTENPDRPWVVTEMRNGHMSYVYLANFDWYNYIYDDTRPTQDYNVTVSGGGKNANYMVSARYYGQKGVFRISPDYFHTINTRAKVDIKIRPWLRLSSNTKFYNGKYDYSESDVRKATLHALASFVPQNPDGTAVSHTDMTNSATHYIMDGHSAMALGGKNWRDKRTLEVTSSWALTADITPWLKANADFSYKYGYIRQRTRHAPVEYSQYPGVISQESVSDFPDYYREVVYEQNNYVGNAYLSFDNTWKGHHVTATAGTNYETRLYRDLSVLRYDLLSDELSDFNLATGELGTLTGGVSEYALLGFFARATYDWRSRYLIEFNGRYDGSSRFLKGHRWGFFPSVSAGWRLSEEPFMASAKDVINNAKIRLSYGSLGNQNIGYYDYYQTISTSQMNYTFDGASKELQAKVSAPVSTGTWETVTTSDIGMDLGFWKDKLTFSADAYIRDTRGILTTGEKLPSIYGAAEPKVNANDLRTTGWELQAEWKTTVSLFGKPFYYYIGANLADYTARYTKADNPNGLLGSPYVGKRLGEIWGYEVDGLFASDAEAEEYASRVDMSQVVSRYFTSTGPGSQGLHGGDMRYVDLDGDGVISRGSETLSDPGDRKIIGNSQPRFLYGFHAGFQWEGLDFYIFFQGIGHQDWYPGADNQRFWGPYSRPYTSFVGRDFMSDVWTVNNKDAYFPRVRGYDALNSGGGLYWTNSRYLQNVGYLRLKNLTVGYTLPDKWMEKIHVSKMRVYFSGENLWYASRIHSKFLDPEICGTQGTSGTGDVYSYAKTFSLGLTLDF